MTWRVRILYLALALLLAAGIGYGFMPRPVPVELVEVRRGDLVVTVEEEGRTRVRERYVLAAPVAGQARRIFLKVGDTVAAGQVVARIEPARAASLDPRSRAQARSRVEAAEAALLAARETARAAAAEARLAEQELAWAESLGKVSFVSQSVVDQARSRLQAGQASRQAADYRVQVAGHEVAVARAALTEPGTPGSAGAPSILEVKAPVAGRVLAVPHESEGVVQAGQTLIEIGNPASLEVLAEVLSSAAVRIRVGARVMLDRWGGPGALEGRVRVVEPAGFTKVSALGVEEQRVRVLADIVSPPGQWQALGDGYRVEAAFVLWEGRDRLLAPASALFRQGEGWALYVAEEGRARLKAVTLGERNGRHAEVLGGLKAGDPVIAHPDEKIVDSVRVRARPR